MIIFATTFKIIEEKRWKENENSGTKLLKKATYGQGQIKDEVIIRVSGTGKKK
jgi:hypothetical protein